MPILVLPVVSIACALYVAHSGGVVVILVHQVPPERPRPATAGRVNGGIR
jgi:hypothetical protein